MLGGTWLARLVSSQLYEVRMADPGIWILVIAIIVVTLVAASWRPGRVAMRTDPLTLLREE
jgi:hypothetical protein